MSDKLFKKIVFIILSAVMAVCSVIFIPDSGSTAYAVDFDAEIEEKQGELEDTKALIAELQSSMDQRETEAAELKLKIAEIELEIAEMDKKIAENEDKILGLSTELDEIQTGITDLNTKKETYTAGMEERLTAIYMHSLYDDLEYLMYSSSIVDFINRINTVSTICKYDSEQLREYEVYEVQIDKQEELVLEKRKQYANIESELNAQRDKIQELYDTNAETQAKLDDEIAYYEQAKTEEENEAKLLGEQVKLLQAQYSNYKALLAQRSAQTYDGGGNNPNNDGDFIWPLPGVYHIASYFGYRIHPVYGIYKFHSGVDISGSGCSGMSIVAAKSGVVMSAGWGSGYGYNVVIYHGDGYSTLYAHCSSLCVSAGDEVQQGDVVGKVGMTGTATGPHLHYEVLINGSQVNPLDYYSGYN